MLLWRTVDPGVRGGVVQIAAVRSARTSHSLKCEQMPSTRDLVLALLIAAVTALAAKKPVTVESITRSDSGKPVVTGLVWAPDGKSLAYSESNAVWRYDVGTRARKQIVSLSDLENKATKTARQESQDWTNRHVIEQSFAWSKSGQEMLVSAGGDLFLVHLADARVDQLTATGDPERDPKLSPDGQSVSFRREHDLYTLNIASRKTARLTTDGTAEIWNGEPDWVYPEELYLSTAHWWSPDSRRIAYLQFDVSREPVYPQLDLLGVRARLEPERYPQPGDPNADVRLGVVQADGGPTRWIDLGDTRDALLARVYWSPDSVHIAVERLNRIQNRLDLLLLDVLTGESRLLLREQDPFWINVGDEFRFLQDGAQFLWSSERDGFRHLYLYRSDGKEIRQLTRGNWEVTAVDGVDERARQVFFTSTQATPLERHLYRVALEGGEPQRMTIASGTHSVLMPAGCEHYLDSFSSVTTPPRRTLHTGSGAEIAVFSESDRTIPEEYEILTTEIHNLKAPDGTLLYARMIRPPGFTKDRKYPAIVYVYGGPQAQDVVNRWADPGLLQVLAHKGYVVWQVDNRGSWGRGHRFESAIFRKMGRVELEDQRAGLRYLESLGFVDSRRMGIYGWSYGGFMTLYSMLNAPGLFRAGISGAPVTDFRNYDTIYTERYMGVPADNPEGYDGTAVARQASRLDGALLLIHNFQDDNVHFQNTLQLADALERAGKQFELAVYPQKTHHVSGQALQQMYDLMVGFLDRSLK
jgi:dipeptidyl-peptidase 4